MKQTLQFIDNFTEISENLAISGQPVPSQLQLIRDAGYQMLVHIQVNELETTIKNERALVLQTGLLYEGLSLSFYKPDKTVFEEFAETLQQYRKLKIYVHCTVGYCTSALLIPYLMLYENYTREEAFESVIIKQFDTRWMGFIDDLLNDYKSIISA